MNTDTSENLISLRIAARRLDISVRGLYRLIAKEDLPHPVKVGGASKLFESDIENYMEKLRSKR